MSKATPQVDTIRELGRKVRRSPSTIHGYLSHREWRWGRGPWSAAQIKEIEKWASTFAAGKTNPELTAARIELLREQLSHLNLQNDIASGRYCTADAAERLIVETTLRAKQSLMDLCWRVRVMAEQSAEPIHEEMAKYLDQVVDTYEKEIAEIPDKSTAEADPITIKRRKRRRTKGAGDTGEGGAGEAGLHSPGSGSLRQGTTEGGD